MNRPVKYNMPNGSEKTIEYNSEESYTIVTDESGIKTKNVYDGLGRIRKKYRLYGETEDLLESYEYDNAGRISEKTYGQSGSSKVKEVYTYDALDRLLTKKVYENTWTLLYTENYTYSSGTITVATTAADGTVTANKITKYDKYGNIIKTEAVSGETTISSTSEYDYLDREVKVTDANGNSTIYEYNCNGQAVKVTDALGNEVETVYDLAGQAVSVTDAKGNTTVTDYDKLGRAVKVTAPFDGTQNAITKTYYDKNSNVVKTSVRKNGPLYTTSENKYDNMDNLIASISGEGEETSVVQYSYDNANRMTKMITGLAEYSENPVGGNVTTYEYGTNGFLSKVTDPMGKSEEYYSYDEYGNVTGKYDKNGEVFCYTYGAYGLKKETIWAYGEKEYTYNSIGQLIKTTDKYLDRDDIIETYTYDVFGRMISTTANDGTVQNYTYDNNSNVLTYNMQKGENEQNNIVYEYDSLNRLTKLTNNDNIFTYTYDKNSNLTDVIDAANANIDTHISYNSANLPVTYRNRYGGKDFSYNMTYDLLGQKKQKRIQQITYQESIIIQVLVSCLWKKRHKTEQLSALITVMIKTVTEFK